MLMNNELKNTVVAAACETLGEFDVDYNEYAVEEIVEALNNKKQGLREILSKHPNWSDEKQAVIIKAGLSRDINTKKFTYDMGKITQFFLDRKKNERKRKELHDFYKFCIENCESHLVTEQNTEGFAAFGIDAPVGKKISKLINQFYGKYLDTQNPKTVRTYNQLYAKIADDVSPSKIERNTILSIHPCDFLTQSNGVSWTSCHWLNSDYRPSGSFSYMNDETSMVFYTLEKDKDMTKPWEHKKLTRTMFHWDDGLLIQARDYPFQQAGASEAHEEAGKTIREQYRLIVEEIFATALNLPNFWYKYNKANGVDYWRMGNGATAYCDLSSSAQNTATRLKNFEKQKDDDMVIIGGIPMCPICGAEHGNNKYLHCPDCCGEYDDDYDDDYVTCSECGERIHRDNAYWSDYLDDYLCDDCNQWCDYHSDYEPVGRFEFHLVDNGNKTYCEDALNDDYSVYYVDGDYFTESYMLRNSDEFAYCTVCETWKYRRDNGFLTLAYDTGEICGDCQSSDGGHVCSGCGEYIMDEEELHNVGDAVYCRGCVAGFERVGTCSNCGVVILVGEDHAFKDGNLYCADCVQRQQ